MRHRIPLRLAVAVTAALSSVATLAEEIESARVVVTATRTAQTVDETLSSVSVITRKDIERAQATSLPELLGRVQGLDFTQNGGRGNSSSVFIRGTNSDHTIVLIDGVRVGSATLGTTAFETIPLENIDRIEVVRGPRSSLYGSNAIGGVIQIFTRESDAPRASVGSGSHNFGRLSAGYGKHGDQGGFSIDFAAEETDGTDSRDNNCCGIDEPDDDGFESQSVSLRGNRRIGSNLELSGSLLAADTENEFDGNFQNGSDQDQTVVTGRLDWSITETWQSRFSLGYSTDETDNFLDGTEASHFDTARTDFNWQNDFTFGHSQIVTAGIDVLRDEVDSSVAYTVDERETTGVFLQHQWLGSEWDTQASIRREFFDDGFDNPNPGGDTFDDQTTGNAALGYRFNENVRMFGSYGTAFRAPSFNELYFPGFGNADLDPEKSETLEVGLKGRNGALSWEVAAYRTEIEDLIATTQTSPGVFEPLNVDKAEIQGLEVALDGSWENWHTSFNADFKSPKDGEGNQLPRRSEHSFNAGLTRIQGDWTFGTDVSYQGPRFDDTSNTTRLDSYTLIDLRAGWSFAPAWQANFKVENAGDIDYQLVDTYKTEGRTFLFQLNWQPGV